jgi:hypothetical protein
MSKKYKLFQYCPVKEKVVPIEQVERRVQSRAVDYFIQDEMAPTRNPLNPKEVYTSKSKLRAVYKAAGAVEIGDAYDRGYAPEQVRAENESRAVSNVMRQIRERMNG